MNGTLSRRMPLINFHKFNLLLPIQAWVSSTLFGGRLSFMSMQFTESKYEQHTTVVSGPYYLERCKHQPVLQNLVKLDRIEKANCIFEWDPANLQPGQSILIASTSQIKIHKQKESYLRFSFKSTNQQLDSQQILIRWFECTKIHRVQKRSLWCKSTTNQISRSPFYLS